MRIAMIGSRGVPASSGGVEKVVERLGGALARRGHDVTVFCRSNYAEFEGREYQGMRLRVQPTVGTKHLDAIVQTTFATVEALRGYDVLHYHALGPGILAGLPRALSRSAIVQTVHGIDWQRAKWGPFARRVLRGGELMSTRVPHELTVPSDALAKYYRERHGIDPTVIPNPFPPLAPRPPARTLDRYGLEPRRYILFVGRLVPEKQIDTLLRAYRRVETDHRLVVVGGSSFTDSYVDELETLAARDERVVMTGALHGPDLEELFSNATAFASPSALESFNITLVEAISAELPIVASSIEPHVELLTPMNGATRFHEVGDERALASGLTDVLENPDHSRTDIARYKTQLLDTFSPERVAELTEAVYERALAAKRRRR